MNDNLEAISYSLEKQAAMVTVIGNNLEKHNPLEAKALYGVVDTLDRLADAVMTEVKRV